MKSVLLIDGGHLRVISRQNGYHYKPDFIESVAHTCIKKEETLIRIIYYDCPPFQGTVKLPVSGQSKYLSLSGEWLNILAAKQQFAIRRGVLKFRGFVPKKTPIVTHNLTDNDFVEQFEQKGVDMRIGLDMANFAAIRSVDRIILITNDTDLVPAMKLARIAGIQVVLVNFPHYNLAPELTWHSDFQRDVQWPETA